MCVRWSGTAHAWHVGTGFSKPGTRSRKGAAKIVNARGIKMAATHIGAGSCCLALAALVSTIAPPGRGVAAQQPTAHVVFMTAVEIKGSTTSDKLRPPSTNPTDLSKGYGFTPPGDADRNAPQKWEVSSYLFAPGFITVHQGDSVTLTVFVVNGDSHEVRVVAPDGRAVMPARTWHRGQEYRVSFVAERVGTYQLSCSAHAPTMTASILVLPR
jgi:plastocyanin